MPSSFSPNLRIELIGAGEQAGTWNATTNTNFSDVIEAAIAGYKIVTTVSVNQALSVANGAADEARSAMLALDTAAGANFSVYAPPTPKMYAVKNLSATYTATIYNSTIVGNTTAAGAGVTIPTSTTQLVMSDGTNFTRIGEISATTNTPNTLVKRDGSGNFSAGTITADLTGNTTGTHTGPVVGGVTGNISGTAANVTGVVAIANGGTAGTSVADAKTNLQTGRLEPRTVSSDTTVLASDAGRVLIRSAGNVTVNTSVLSAGDVVTIYNADAAMTIVQGAGAQFIWINAASGSRTLATGGLCTILCVNSTQFVVIGQGIT